MTHLRIILALAIALLFVPTLVPAQPFNPFVDPFVDSGAEMLADLDLTPKQKQQIKTILVTAEKESIKLRADVRITGVDLRTELEKDAPNEKTVGALIEKVSGLEGKIRKSRVISWLRIRKLLTAKQRGRLERFDNSSWSSSKNFRRFSKNRAQIERELERAAEKVERAAEEIEQLLDNPFRSAGCDEVTCLVDPDKACCQQMEELRYQLKKRKNLKKKKLKKLKKTKMALTQDQMGFLTIASKPYATIYVDGRKVGVTPLVRLSLAPGIHTVKVVQRLGVSKILRIRIRAGKESRRNITTW